MPRSSHSEKLVPCENQSSNVVNFTSSDTSRLEKLESEVDRLRYDIDKIKWQRAAAETAIERAIVRGAAALGGRYKILVGDESDSIANNRSRRINKKDQKDYPNTDGASNESIASNDSRLMKKNTRKPANCEEAVSENKNNNNTSTKGKAASVCGQYKFG